MYYEFKTKKPFEGTVTLRQLSFDERMECFEEMGVMSVEGLSEADQSKMGMKLLRAVGKKSSNYVKECSIKCGDKTLTDWQEVYHNPKMTGLIVEVLSEILGKM
jgi:hypothetical protein